MNIITLTTDMGYHDHYAATVKANILCHDKTIQIVDITHHVKPFDLKEAAYFVRAAFEEFPEGTVHLITLNCEPVIHNGDGYVPAILFWKGHYFVANDNGFFALLLQGEQPDGFWHLDNALSNPKAFVTPIKSIYIPCAVELAKNQKPELLASPVEQWKIMHSVQPVVEENLIKGTVIHIDHYGNVITNINRQLVERFGDIPYTIYFRKRDLFIPHISNTYSDVTPGERLALFNTSGLLEIAINKGGRSSGGGADSLLGLRLDDVVRIEFTPRGSALTIDSLF